MDFNIKKFSELWQFHAKNSSNVIQSDSYIERDSLVTQIMCFFLFLPYCVNTWF